jgi:hypothetical protein
MSEWILIMTLFALGPWGNGGSGITTINGFMTEKQCVTAGETFRKANRASDYYNFTFACILRTK